MNSLDCQTLQLQHHVLTEVTLLQGYKCNRDLQLPTMSYEVPAPVWKVRTLRHQHKTLQRRRCTTIKTTLRPSPSLADAATYSMIGAVDGVVNGDTC